MLLGKCKPQIVFVCVMSAALISGCAHSSEHQSERLLFMKGLSLYHGYDGVVDIKVACDYFERAAKLDYARAQVEFGNCYRTGEGRVQNIDKAVYWYKKAAKNGARQAGYLLGSIYLLHTSFGQYRDEAIKLLSEESQKGNPDAMFLMGVAYHRGISVKADDPIAIKYYVRAGNGSSIYAQLVLREIYRNGLYGNKTDNEKADYWERMALNNERYMGGDEFIDKILQYLYKNNLGLDKK